MPISRSRRARRWRVPLLVAVALLVAVIVAKTSGGGGHSSSAEAPAKTVLVVRRAASLPVPISGESVVGLAGGPLILGGLDASETSVSGVFQLDASGAHLKQAGELAGPLHDAAAATLGNRVLVFGGGAEASSSEVQALPAPGGSVSAGALASVVGRLPTPRSDLSAVAIGERAYLLGGYDGQAPLGSVLATADGGSFTEVATLPKQARYMAVAASGGKIYALGGELASGRPSDAIQEVDPRRGTARVVGHLPEPTSHAAAVELGGRVYLLGGDADGVVSDRIWRFDPANGTIAPAGRLPLPVAYGAATVVGSTAYLIGGKGADGSAVSSVLVLRERVIRAAHQQKPEPPLRDRALPGSSAAVCGSPADRRPWQQPAAGRQLPEEDAWRFRLPRPPGAPWRLLLPRRRLLHPPRHPDHLQRGAERAHRPTLLPRGQTAVVLRAPRHRGLLEPGYLHEPDDAYLWQDGTISVADAQNCRVLLISPQKKILKQFGEPARCEHDARATFATSGGIPATLNDAVRRAAAAAGAKYVNLNRVSAGHDACQPVVVLIRGAAVSHAQLAVEHDKSGVRSVRRRGRPPARSCR